MTEPRIEVAVLGPLELRVDGRPIALHGPKRRIVLATLAADPERVVSAERLVAALWGDDPPRSAEHSVQQHISVLRKELQAAGVANPAAVVVTRPPGYLLVVDGSDITEWQESRSAGLQALDGADALMGIDHLDRALSLWRGSALEDVDDADVLVPVKVQLDEQRIAAQEARAQALLIAGRPSDAVADLAPLLSAHPLREGLWSKLMVALYRSGRQADALAAFQSAREALVEGLGIEPSAALRELEAAILQQRPELDADPLVTAPSPAPGDELFVTFLPERAVEVGRVVFPDGQEVLLSPGVSTIGRDPASLVHLVDNRVSRVHASIEATDAACVVRDLCSSNGTTVNGVPVTEHTLADGDVIGIGGVTLVFKTPAARRVDVPDDQTPG
jgi:DNA-binding SARP family transcriptional activator